MSQFDRLELIESFKKKKISVASFHVKLKNHWFDGYRKTDKELEDQVLQMISQIKHKIYKLDEKLPPKNLTWIPNYDIAYEEIMPELEEQRGSKFKNVSNNLHKLKDIFGLRNVQSLYDIHNQSFFTLTANFPELLRKVRKSEIKTNYLKYHKPVRKRILGEPSRILCDRDATKVRLRLTFRSEIRCRAI